MNKKQILFLIVIFLLLFQNHLLSQEQVTIKKLTTPIDFDGRPFEPAWEGASLFPMVMHSPDYGNQPSEKCEVMIGHDNEFLWVAARLYMRDASKIFEATKKRDDELFGYDAFGILLDTYNDKENGLAFFTTPTGSRTDYTIANDASSTGGGFMEDINSSWNTFWDVLTTRDGKGWYVEMRIPFSSLRFKPINNVAVMGLIISRTISEHNETDTYPAIDPKYGYMAPNKPSLAAIIRIEGAEPTNPIYLSPYVIGGFSREYVLNKTNDDYVKNDEPDYNGGLDVKLNLNSNLTLDLTANTDFAQVESDDQQVNLTRYDLFFPEKRMFFQERSSLFSFSLGGRSDNMFYSRNIGIAGESQVRILGGARLVGRIGRWDMGLMDMQTAESGDLPGENFGVLRMRRQVINPNSYIGFMTTSRIGMTGNYNVGYGLDGIFRLYGDDYLNIKWAQSYDDTLSAKNLSLEPSFIMVNWERRSEEGLGYNFNYTYLGEKFKPGIGYVQRADVQGVNARILYGWIPGEESRLFNYNVSVKAERYVRLTDGNPETSSVEPGFEINTKSGIHFEISVKHQQEGVLEDFALSESDSVWIKAGNYRFTELQSRFGTPNSRLISMRGNINAGQFYDGQRYGFRTTTNLNFSSSFKLTAGYEFNAIRFPERLLNNKLNIHSVNARAIYMFSTKLSVSLLVQYLNTEDEFISNFRLRYNPREGNDFYLVFNESRGLSGKDEFPAPPPFYNRTFVIKYTHTFIL
jgi:hypothetical protein